MANQTLTTGTQLARVNLDSSALSGLNNGETITINGGHLLIDGDTRWGNNGAVFDSIAISSTLGGSVLIDGTQVWEVPFSAATGNVPARDVAGNNPITGTGVTGELISVWGESLDPYAVGGGIAAPGRIKLRSKTGDFSDGLVVTLPNGATVTCSGTGKRSWINVVGEEAGTATVPRLGAFTVRGDWYDLGTTNGADDQTFQFPVGDACPAIQIETAAGSGVYEWWLNAGGRWATIPQFVSTDVRGKYFAMTNTTGVIVIAQRSSNPCGYKPPTGCKVRVPNVILSSSNTTVGFLTNTLHSTASSRYDFTTSAAGVIDIDTAVSNWYIGLTNAFRVSVKNTAILHTASFSNIADTLVMDDCALGLNSTNEYSPLTISNCFTSVTLNKVRAVRYSGTASAQYTLSLTDVANYTETDCQMEAFGTVTAVTRGSAGINSRAFTRLVGTNVLTRPVAIGCYVNLTTCANTTVKDMIYADLLNSPTTATTPMSAISVNSGSSNVWIDGFSAFGGLADVHPYTAVVTVTSGSQLVDVRNIGTPAAPYNCGSANATANVIVASVMVDLRLRRIYTQNVRTSVLSIVNTVQGVVCDNVWGDGADVQSVVGASLAGANFTSRGCRWTQGTTGQNSVYGKHWEDAFQTTTAGRLVISCNEPLAETADQCQITAGAAAFTSGGQVAMPVVGDEVVWTMPYFMLGVTSFANSNPTVTGTGATFVSGNNWTNFFLDFQYDTGSGFNGTWLALNGATLNGIGAIDPTTGVRLMVRAQTKTAATTNALTYLRFDTVTNATDQQIVYPLPQTQLTVTGFESGSDIVVYDATTPADGSGSNVLATGDAVSGSFVFDYNGTPQIKIGVFKGGFVPQVTPLINLTATDSSYTIQQRADRNYS